MENKNTFDEAEYAHMKNLMTPEQYAEFICFQKNKDGFKAYKSAERISGRKKAAGQNFFVRRQSLVLRRVNQEEIAPDEDVLAYEDIYKLKKAKHEENGTYEEKMKIPVSDEEITAFRALEDAGHYYNDITLEMLDGQLDGCQDENLNPDSVDRMPAAA